jgi:hypothetical protein
MPLVELYGKSNTCLIHSTESNLKSFPQ